MSDIKPERRIDWGQLRFWQTVDPIPWWILDRGKLEQILVVQLEAKIQAKKVELQQLEKIREIVAAKTPM